MNEVRAGELQVALPARTDAELCFIGRVSTPWTDRPTCPREGGADGPASRLQVFAPWGRGLDCLDGTPLLDVKPDRTLFKPLAPAQASDFQVSNDT